MSKFTQSINLSKEDLKIYQQAIRNVTMNTLEFIEIYNPENKSELLEDLIPLGTIDKEFSQILKSLAN